MRYSEYEKPSLDLIKRLARERGGKCLSDVYTGVRGRYLFRCNCGREWTTDATNLIARGAFCVTCSHKNRTTQVRKTIEDARALAFERGGQFLSTEFGSAKDRYQWKCGACDHEWTTTYNSVQRGSWCPSCGGQAKTKFDRAAAQLTDLLRAHGFRLLSDYSGALDPITFACSAGHETTISQAGMAKFKLTKGRLRCRSCIAAGEQETS